MPGSPARPRRAASTRGRPPKYGAPAVVVAVTLPVDVVTRLRAIHEDLGWAIVSLTRQTTARRSATRPASDVQLVDIGSDRALIVVDPAVVHGLPGVQIVPLSSTQALLALETGRGLADLEVAVADRLDRLRPGSEHRALTGLLAQLRQWRRGRRLSFDTRSIILVRRPSRRHRIKST